VIYLALPELLHVAGRVLGPDVAVRDYGLLEAAELDQVEEISAILQGATAPAIKAPAPRSGSRAFASTGARLLRPPRSGPAPEGPDCPDVSVANENPPSLMGEPTSASSTTRQL